MNKEIEENKITGLIIDDESKLAAIVIPIIDVDGVPSILFEERAFGLPDQPGDICFPGGMIEEGEAPLEAALRECCEELLISEDNIEMIGPSNVYHSPSMAAFPYVIRLKDYEFSFSKDEIASVFTIPIKYFVETEPEKHMLEWDRKCPKDFPYDKIIGGKDYKWRKQRQAELFYEYKDHVIWGFTARILYYDLVRHALKTYNIQY